MSDTHVLLLEFSSGIARRPLSDVVREVEGATLVVDPLAFEGTELSSVATAIVSAAGAPEVVVGSCGGAPLALEIAGLCGALAVVLDPELAGVADAEAAYAAMTSGRNSELVGRIAREGALSPSARVALTEELVAAVAHDAPELPAELVSELVGKQAAWLCYLLLASAWDPARCGGVAALSLLSRGRPADLPGAYRSFDVDSDGLFASPDVAREVGLAVASFRRKDAS